MMIHQQTQFVAPDVNRFVEQVKTEDARFDRELRSQHREKIVLSVTVKFLNGDEAVDCFSRNLSGSGACLLSSQPFTVDSQCVLKIHHIGNKDSNVIAIAKWSRPFGNDNFISGWQFLRMAKISDG